VRKTRNLSLAIGPGLNRTQELTQRLSEEIRSGRLAPGSRLPTEQELSEATGVSRTVVREAVAALRADGLVKTRQGLGAFVASDVQRWPFRIDASDLKTVADVLQVIELRMSLEVEASGLAAERRSNDDFTRIKKALAAIETEIKGGGNAVEADFQFHLAIFNAAKNRYFANLLQFLGHFIIPRQTIHMAKESEKRRERYLHRIQSEHVAIFEAISARNAAAARRAARRHLSNALRRYQQSATSIARIDEASSGAVSANDSDDFAAPSP
jgi:GntR family transcriptional regulator, transcriptional repressor for pyruvate dehydrogenase complex